MADRIDVGLLGGVEVRYAEAPVVITGAKLKAIVAMLALGAPHPVSADRLIDELWGDEPPAHPTNALQGQISALRRLLGRDAVELRGPGYVLAVGPDDVDTIRFERLIRAGRDAVSGGDSQAGAQHYTAALGLLRGRPLDDLGDYRFARDAASRLHELILSAHEGLMDAQLAIGAHSDVVSVLTGLVRANPLRERFYAQLMLALYRCGRQADALRTYQEARNALVEELGVDPGSELQTLERAVLAHDAALDAPVVTPASAASPASSPSTPGRLPLVGRESEFSSLRADLDAIRAGHGRVTLVGGEPGIGKTRLTEELTATATAQGVTVIWGRCYEGRGAPAFWPWTQIVNGLLARFDDDVLRVALGSDAGELAQIAPEVKELVIDFEPPPPLDPESARFGLYRAISGFIRRLARTQPLMLVVDDLHWADEPSLGLVTFLATDIDNAALLIVGTYRNIDPSLGGALAQTLVELSRRLMVRQIELRGLDLNGIGELLSAAGTWPSEELLGTVHRRTQGNPFFVTELLRLLPAEGPAADAHTVRQAVPAGVKGVIRQRVARLPDATTRTITFAATLGQEFDLAILAASIDVDGATLLDHLEPAIDGGILVDNPDGTSRYRFSHGLVNETIYDDLGPGQRARTHHRIAQTLDTHHGDSNGSHLLAIAAHWFHAVPAAPPDRGIDAALRAAQWAQGHVAHQQAKEQLLAALELIAGLPEGRQRAGRELEVQDQLSALLIIMSGYSTPGVDIACARMRELCRTIDDPRLLVPALWRLSIFYVVSTKLDTAVALGDQLLELAQLNDDPATQLAGHMALAIIRTHRGEIEAGRRHFDAALELADAGHDRTIASFVAETPAVWIRVFSAWNLWISGEEARSEEVVLDAVRIATTEGVESYAMTFAVWFASLVATLRHDVTASRRYSEEGIVLATAGGYGMCFPFLAANLGWALAAQGDIEGGSAQILAGEAGLHAAGAGIMRHVFPGLLADAYLRADRYAEAVESADRGLFEVEATGERWYESELHRLRGEARAALGHADDAREEFHNAIRISTSQGALGLLRRAEDSLARASGTG